MINVTEWVTMRVTAPAAGSELKVQLPQVGWKGMLLQNLDSAAYVYVASTPGEAKAGRGIVVRPHPAPDVHLKRFAVARDGQAVYVSASGAAPAEVAITLFR